MHKISYKFNGVRKIEMVEGDKAAAIRHVSKLVEEKKIDDLKTLIILEVK